MTELVRTLEEEIKALLQLQDIDLDLDRFTEECESIIPAEINVEKNKINEMKENFENRKKALNEVLVKHKSLELEISTKDSSIAKRKTELNSIKTNEQYKALTGEISKEQQDKSKLEDQMLELLEKIDENKKICKSEEVDIKETEQTLLDNIKLLEKKKSEYESQIIGFQEQRKKTSEEVSPEKLKKYEHIRKKSKDGIVIAPIENNICGSCHLGLPPQVINEVSKNEGLVFCDNCSRILCILK